MQQLYWIILLFFPLIMWGQNQKATQEALGIACNCLQGVSWEKVEQEKLSNKVDSCLEEGLYVNFSGVMKEQGASLDKDSSMLALAQYLQQELTRSCASFRQASKSLATQQLQEIKQENQSSQGILYALNTNQQFPVFVLLTVDNQLEKFVWLHEFDGSTRFMQGIKPYWYTQVEIVWKEVELYDQVTNSYPYYKEILLIEEKEKIDKKRRKAWIKAYEQAAKRKD